VKTELYGFSSQNVPLLQDELEGKNTLHILTVSHIVFC